MASNTVRLDMRKLLEIEQRAPGRIDEAVGRVAFTCQAEVVDHFNTQSPAPPGEPPGVDTGTLRASVGPAARVKPRLWRLGVGAEYGLYLEYGTIRMAARPFMLPAVERTVRQVPDIMKGVIEG